MNTTTFRPMAHTDSLSVIAMMTALYDEDASGYVSPAHFRHTTESLVRMPERGRIVVFDAGTDRCVGYAILIPYWSNEFGGSIVEVDELFVRPDFRARGVGRAFVAWVEAERPFGAIAIELEVTPENRKAQEFYRRMGFAARKNVLQVKRLGEV